MSVTLNTYGLRSINAETFNTYGSPGSYLPRHTRDIVTTLLRINNLALNILEYIPGGSQLSGTIRMGIGSGIIVLTLAVGSPTANSGLIVGRWYIEALAMGVAQISRGAIAAFSPSGKLINMSLDLMGTFLNINTEISHFQCGGFVHPEELFEEHEEGYGSKPPYCDADYPSYLFFLSLV